MNTRATRPANDSAGDVEDAALTVDAIEVTQAIQNPAHDVPLVAGKRTVIRIFVTAQGVLGSPDTPAGLRGEIRVRRTVEGRSAYLPSINTVTPVSDPLSVQRGNANAGLNFLLPDEWTEEGDLDITVSRVEIESTGLPLTLTGDIRRVVDFATGIPLRLRLIGIRYTDAGRTYTPRAVDFEMLLSWIRRAYPVPAIASTRIVVDAMSTDRPLKCGQINAQISALRNQDLASGTDPRIHYLALVPDGEGTLFMRGCSSGIPVLADPSVTASAPAGAPDAAWSWDNAASYAGWYGGHELGHTFGRPHPGFCAQNNGDPDFPYPAGRISDHHDFVGFDTGDPAHGLPMRALSGQDWHDVMTYCERQWVSFHTSEKIRLRLLEEDMMDIDDPAGDAQEQQPLPDAAGPSPGGSITLNVIGTIDLTAGVGDVMFVNPVPGLRRPEPEPATSDTVVVRLDRRGGSEPVEVEVPIRFDSSAGVGGSPRTGMIDAVVQAPRDLAAVELRWQDKVLDIFDIGEHTGGPQRVRLAAAPAGATRAEAGPSPVPRSKRRIEWDPAGVGERYTVQVSDDGGASWQTAVVNQRDTSILLDTNAFRSDQLKLRVTATNGIESDTTELDVNLPDR
ncbi:hypothetical protein ACFW9U_26690 [Rhodococcus aetherivorans]|uniref:hypothetical protein n=1 Tax=Rhodococcus aetherivorans TaxID=191292 RepID=UPI003671F54C